MNDTVEKAPDYLARLISNLREANNAGHLAGLTFVTFSVAENDVSARRAGQISRRRRMDDVDRLAAAVERNRNFTKVFQGPCHPRDVTDLARWYNEDAIKDLERRVKEGLVEGICAVVYGADGSVYAVSRSVAPLAAMRRALECLSDCAWGEDGIVNSGGYLNEDLIYLPSADVDERAKAQGIDLVGEGCPHCGKPTRLVQLEDRRVEFACRECKSIFYSDS